MDIIKAALFLSLVLWRTNCLRVKNNALYYGNTSPNTNPKNVTTMKLILNYPHDDETDPKRPRGPEFHARITHIRRICAYTCRG